MPWDPRADPPTSFVTDEEVTAQSLNDALDEARRGRSPYRVYAHRDLTDPAIGAMTVASDGSLDATLMDWETLTGGIAGDQPFVTFFEGALHLAVGTAAKTVEVRLTTLHRFAGGRLLSATRTVWERTATDARHTIPMADWNSVSTVREGSVTGDDGQPLVIDDALLAADVDISLTLSLHFYNARDRTQRAGADVLELTGDDLAVTWWQLRTPED